ncbi:hypothetical protein V5799_018755, partial [Amblyomma americanum]
TNYPLKMKLSRGPLLDEAPVMEVSYEGGPLFAAVPHLRTTARFPRCPVVPLRHPKTSDRRSGGRAACSSTSKMLRFEGSYEEALSLSLL